MQTGNSKWLANGSWILSSVLLSVVGISCNDDLGPDVNLAASPEISTTSNTEMVIATQEVMDITGAGMSSQGITYGRAGAHEGDEDWDEHHLCGATVSKNFTFDNSMPDSLILSGSITIDFGDGTNCPDSAYRHNGGKISTEFIINVNLKNHQYTSTETVTMDEFRRGSKTLSGVFHAKAASGGMRWLDIINAQLTYYPDNDDDDGEDDDEEMNSTPTTVTWSGSLTFQYDNNGTFKRDDDTKTITGSITATTSAGEFTSEIVEGIVIKSACFHGRNIPVSGIVNITSAGVLTVVDFGDGTCDKLYTSTTGGETIELHL